MTNGPQPTVYVVDDDEVVRDSLKVLLESRHYAVEDFASGKDFLSCVDGQGVGCLVLDIHMPQMTGIDVLRQLRKDGSHIPVIMVTGRQDAATRAQAESLGAAAFLDKPVAHKQLFAAIEKALADRAE
jgi:FixJ family two-component response regulator